MNHFGSVAAQITVAGAVPTRPRWGDLPEFIETETGAEVRALGRRLLARRGQVHEDIRAAGLSPKRTLEPLRKVLRTAARNGFSVLGTARALLCQAELAGEPRNGLPLTAMVIAAAVDVLEEGDRPFWHS